MANAGGSSTIASGDNGLTIAAVITADSLAIASSSSFTAPGQVVVETTANGATAYATLGFTATGSGVLTGLTWIQGNTAGVLSTGNTAIPNATHRFSTDNVGNGQPPRVVL